MEVRVDCPSPLYKIQPGDDVKVKRICSYVSSGSYLACLYDNKVVGMLDDIKSLMNMSEDEYISGKVISSTIVNGSTILMIELL